MLLHTLFYYFTKRRRHLHTRNLYRRYPESPDTKLKILPLQGRNSALSPVCSTLSYFYTLSLCVFLLVLAVACADGMFVPSAHHFLYPNVFWEIRYYLYLIYRIDVCNILQCHSILICQGRRVVDIRLACSAFVATVICHVVCRLYIDTQELCLFAD